MSCWSLSYNEQTYKQPAIYNKESQLLVYEDYVDYIAFERKAAKEGLKIMNKRQNI
jgi:hypothetical protein